MAYYTTKVQTICESFNDLDEPGVYSDVATIIENALPHIFDFEFPIWDENYRTVLETKILKHYYTREIGAETYGLWKLWLDEKLNLIMPYYNSLYKTTLYEFNPLYDVDVKTSHVGNGNHKRSAVDNTKDVRTGSSGESVSGVTIDKGTNENVEKYSDTPQGGIQGLAAGNYMTTATIDNGANNRSNARNEKTSRNTNDSLNHSRTNTERIDNTDAYIEHVFGTHGNRTFAAKILEFRKTILNIDNMIIEELKDLFYGLWG